MPCNECKMRKRGNLSSLCSDSLTEALITSVWVEQHPLPHTEEPHINPQSFISAPAGWENIIWQLLLQQPLGRPSATAVCAPEGAGWTGCESRQHNGSRLNVREEPCAGVERCGLNKEGQHALSRFSLVPPREDHSWSLISLWKPLDLEWSWSNDDFQITVQAANWLNLNNSFITWLLYQAAAVLQWM